MVSMSKRVFTVFESLFGSEMQGTLGFCGLIVMEIDNGESTVPL
jgi:hypothetical protein